MEQTSLKREGTVKEHFRRNKWNGKCNETKVGRGWNIVFEIHRNYRSLREKAATEEKRRSQETKVIKIKKIRVGWKAK